MNCTTSARFVSPTKHIFHHSVLDITDSVGRLCNTKPLDGKQLQGFGTDGTSVLGGVTYILPREEIEKGAADKEHKFPPMYQELLTNRLNDQELIEGKVVIILYQWCRHNLSKTHDVLDWAIVEKRIKVKKGNVVELRLHKPYAIVTGILSDDIEKSECKWIIDDRGGFVALNIINPVEGPGTANLYCPHL